MPDLTRRQLLGKSLGAATAGAAIVGGATVIPKLLGPTVAEAAGSSRGSDAKYVVAYVKAGASGEVHVLSGNREVVVKDAHLASRLRSASAG